MNSEARPPGRIAGIINRLFDIADAIGITGLVFQAGNTAHGEDIELLVTTRTGCSLSLKRPSMGDEESADRGGVDPSGCGARPRGKPFSDG